MSSEKRDMIRSISEKIDELLPRIRRSKNEDLFGNILTRDIIEDPFLMTKISKPHLQGVWQDLCQIEFKLNKGGMN